MDSISEILAAFGLTGDIAITVANAIADPTSANVNAVTKAYAANGQIVPGKLYAYLLDLNEEYYPNDTVKGSLFPWLIFGLGAGMFVVRKLIR